jgi:uncharacterized protein YdaU (DUF1376 family)
MTPQEVGVYTMLLCRIYEENGPVEANILRLSTYCGMREKSFQVVFQKLFDLGKFHLVDGSLMNHRAEREIAKRSNDLKTASNAGKASAQKRQQKQSPSATTVERPFNHTDTDTDTVKDTPNGVSKKIGSRLSDEWLPSEEDRAFATAQGLNSQAILFEADRFRDHWVSKAGRDGAKLDWPATWRNWVRNGRTRSRAHDPPRKTAFQQHQDECAAELDKVINRSRGNDEFTDNIIDLAAADFRSHGKADTGR